MNASMRTISVPVLVALLAGGGLHEHYDSHNPNLIVALEGEAYTYEIEVGVGTVEIVTEWVSMDAENLAELGIEDGRALLDVAPEVERAAREGAFRLFDAFLERLGEGGKAAGVAGGKE